MLSAALRSSLATHGGRPAIDGFYEGRWTALSYEMVASLVRRRMRSLADDPVFDSAASVAVALRNDIESVVDLLSCVLLRKIVVVIDVHQSPERAGEQIAGLSEVHLEHGRAVPVRTMDADERVRGFGSEALATGAITVFTTGTTASAKGVVQSQRAIHANVSATIAHHDLRVGERFLCAMPISHVNGMHFGLFGTLISGGHLWLEKDFIPARYVQSLDDHRPMRANASPAMLASVTGRLGRLPESFAYFVSAAAPLSPAVAAAVAESSGRRVIQGYGSSECMNFTTTMPTDGDAQSEPRSGRLSVGVPLAGVTVAIDAPNESGVGEVVVGGNALMSRYAFNEAETAATISDRGVRTGDLGYLLKQPWGEELYLVGRKKNMFIVGGRHYSLEEIELLVQELTGVTHSLCVVAEDDIGQATEISVVVDEAVTAGWPQLQGCVTRRFPELKRLLRGHVVSAIPRFGSGKPDRRGLQRMITAGGPR